MVSSNYMAAKTFNQNGKWIDRPGKIDVVVCKCGNKYLKTRRNQKTCITCINTAKELAVK